MSRGMVYSAGMFLLAFSLVSMGFELRIRPQDTFPKMIEIERAKRSAESAARSQAMLFSIWCKASFQNEMGVFKASSRLPHDMGEYKKMSQHLAKAALLSNPPVRISMPKDIELMLCGKPVWIRDENSDSVIPPESTVSVSIMASMEKNVSDCKLTYSPGPQRLDISVLGIDGACTVRRFVNLSQDASLNICGSMPIHFSNQRIDLYGPMTYELSIEYDSNTACTPMLLGDVTSSTQRSRAKAGIYIDDDWGWQH